jgi:hypothetical protein
VLSLCDRELEKPAGSERSEEAEGWLLGDAFDVNGLADVNGFAASRTARLKFTRAVTFVVVIGWGLEQGLSHGWCGSGRIFFASPPAIPPVMETTNGCRKNFCNWLLASAFWSGVP